MFCSRVVVMLLQLSISITVGVCSSIRVISFLLIVGVR